MLFTFLTLFSIVMLYFTYQIPVVESKQVSLCNYANFGRYSYLAFIHPNVLYNTTVLGPGEGTLYLKLVKRIAIDFTYRFLIDTPSTIVVNYNVNFSLSSPSGWVKDLPGPAEGSMKLYGNDASFNFNLTLNLGDIFSLIKRIEDETGAYASSYTLTLTPNIHVLASNDVVGFIESSFSPQLTITIKYGGVEGSMISIDGLNHQKSDSVTRSQVIVHEDVKNKLYGFYALLGLSLAGLAPSIYFNFFRAGEGKKDVWKDLVKPLEDYLVKVKSFSEGGSVVFELEDLEDLRKIAEGIGKPILMKIESDFVRIFRVVDGDVIYECRLEVKEKKET